MSDNSSIEWTDATWNPALGCDRVSPGCDGCYAIGQSRIRASNPHPKVAAAFEGLVHRTGERLDWTGRVNMLPGRLDEPLRWRKPKRIFVNSLSDLFHDGISDEFIARVFAVMAATPQHTYQMLTKRHGRMRSLLNNPRFRQEVYDTAADYDRDGIFDPYRYAPADMIPVEYERPAYRADDSDWWPLPNVWLGVSVEDQQRADLRVPALLGTPAAVRWVSAEPLLGPIDLDQPRCDSHDRDEAVVDEHGREWCGHCAADGRSGELSYGHWLDPLNGGLDWVVTGGESGPSARPAHPSWFRYLRDQTRASGAAYFHKQNGAYTWQIDDPYRAPDLYVCREDGRIRQPEDVPGTDAWAWAGVWKVGKKRAGRELDGRTWDEMPTHSHASSGSPATGEGDLNAPPSSGRPR